ncbi:MAG: ABC transporter substrate-binding protein [Bacillota bacterium]|nr:ABC transporter substrate-binding protein [Bacillota bacterium]
MKKKAVSILLSVALAAGMTAGLSVNVFADDNTITFMGWYEEDEMEGVLEALNTELDGKYQVEYTYVAQTDYNNVLSTQLAAGEGPDIVADGTNFPARIKAGNVVEITGEDFLGGFNEAGFALCSDGDKMYGIPSYGWFSGIWYNKALFEENGIKELPKTFDEFVEVCDTFAENDVQPLGFGLADGDTALHSLLGYLENSFYHNNEENPDGVDFDVKFANGEATMNGKLNPSVEKWATLIEKGYINAEMLGIANEQALSDFVAGKTAMFNGGPWQYTNLKEAGMEFGMMPHLSETDGDKYMIGGPAVNFGVNVNSKNQEGAMAVLEALSSVSVQQAFVDANVGGFSYREGVEAEMPAEYDDVKDIINSGNIACTWDRWSVNMPSQSLFDEARAQLQGLVTGDLSAEDYLQSLDDAASSIRYE